MIRLVAKSIRNRVLRIDYREVSVPRRGFNCSSQSLCSHIENIGRSFLAGHHTALKIDSVDALALQLSETPPLYRGFAFEGAGMGLGLTDSLSIFNPRRWSAFLEGPGQLHKYVLHVGLGWMAARLPWCRSKLDQIIAKLDPLLGWLVVDGFGFHEGYFHWRRQLDPAATTPPLSPYGSRAFDQGLGRSLWFVEGTDIHRISSRITQFQPERRADMWSGVGLAFAYAGSADLDESIEIPAVAGEHLLHLAQGVTFAAEARELGGIPADHTERACKAVCGMTASEAAQLTYSCLPSPSNGTSDFEQWRTNIREELRGRGVSKQ